MWGDAAPATSSRSSSSSTHHAKIVEDDTPKPKRSKKNPPVKPSALPAIEVAQSGASYRPATEDHQELLGQAVAYRLRKQDAEKKLQQALRRGRALRMTTDGIGGDAPQVNTDNYSDEEGDDSDDDSSAEEENGDAKTPADVAVDDGEDSEEETVHINQPWTGKKTQSERNKELRRKKHELRVKSSIKKKQLKAQLDKLPEILQEIEAKEGELQQKRKIMEMKKRTEPADVRTKKLGPNRFEEPEPDYLRTDQLPDSLRKLNNANKFSLLRDRFQSLQKRNIIEPRVQQRRVFRYQKKHVEKYSTKDPQEMPK